MVERPAYDVTIFKVHCGKITLKIYTKGERALRIEVIVHNTKAYRRGRSLLEARFVSDDMLEALPQPTQVGQTRAGGIDLNKLRMRLVATAVLALSTPPVGFTASDLA